MEEKGTKRAKEGKTPLILFTKDEILGLYAVADTVKEVAVFTIEKLKQY